MSEKKQRKALGGVYFRESIHGVCVNKGKRGNWWIDYYTGPSLQDRVREKTAALSKTEAATIRATRKADHARGEARLPGQKKVLLLHTLADEYFSYAKTNKSSWKSDACYVKRIKDHFGNVPVDRITRADCEDFKKTLTEEWQKKAWAKAGTEKEKPEIQLTTVDRYVGCLKRIFNWAVDQDRISENPPRRVKLHRQDHKPFYLLSDEEEVRLLQAAGEGKASHMKPIIILALATTMRSNEIRGLRWEQIDLNGRMITLEGESTKNKRVKHVPLNADSLAVVQEQLKIRAKDGIYVFPNREGRKMGSIKTAWRGARKRGGISPRCRFHDLRHTSISRMVMAGVPEVTIGRMAGWTDSSAPFMLRRYAHLTGDHLHQAAKALERDTSSHYVGTNTENEVVVEFEKRIVTV
jgi:integrase